MATVDKDGKDLGNLNLETGTIEFYDFKNRSNGSSVNSGFNSGISLNHYRW